MSAAPCCSWWVGCWPCSSGWRRPSSSCAPCPRPSTAPSSTRSPWPAAGRILLSLGQGRLLSRFMAGYEEDATTHACSVPCSSPSGPSAVNQHPDHRGALPVQRGAARLGRGQRGGGPPRAGLIFVAPMEALDQVFVSLFAVFSRPRAIFFRKYLLAPGLRFGRRAGAVADRAGRDVPRRRLRASRALPGCCCTSVLLVRLLHERGLLAALRPAQVVLPFRAVFEFSFPLITGELALLSMKVGGVMVLACSTPSRRSRRTARCSGSPGSTPRSRRVRHPVPADDRPAALPRQHRRAARELLAHGDVRCRDDVPDLRAHRPSPGPRQ